MPRITQGRRDAKRAEIIAAARHCFSRDGFHQTSMPDIAREAGVSAGAAYRYFAGKEEIILEIAGEAFGVMFAPLERIVSERKPISVADLLAVSVAPVSGEVTQDAAGRPIPVDELLKCAVEAWGELLRNEGMRERATVGFNRVRSAMADALRRGQEAGTVSAELDPDRGARVVMALLHGFILQRAAFGLDDTANFTSDVRTLLSDSGVLKQPDRASRVLTPDVVPAVAWRNGAGFTRELVDDPAGWRLSVAELEVDAEFSDFAGLDRIFLPLVNVVLHIDGVRQAVAARTAVSFPGEASVAVELVAGRGRAVNLMTVRGRCSGGLVAMSRAEWERRDHDEPGLFVDLGEVFVEVHVNF